MDIRETYRANLEALCESTPGIRKALKALGAAKTRNANNAAAGRPVRIGGKVMSASTYKHKFGLPNRLTTRKSK